MIKEQGSSGLAGRWSSRCEFLWIAGGCLCSFSGLFEVFSVHKEVD